jgi:hypothetical protein
VPDQIFHGQFNIAKNGSEKAGTDSLPGVDRNGRHSPILMPKENVAATSSNDLETDSLEDAHDFLALQPGKTGHTEIC